MLIESPLFLPDGDGDGVVVGDGDGDGDVDGEQPLLPQKCECERWVD